MVFITARESKLEQKLVPEAGPSCNKLCYVLCWERRLGIIVVIQARKDTEYSKINGLFFESLEDKKKYR